jgi:hypothetical protein
MTGTTQITPTNTFASQSGSIPLSQLDTNFTQITSFLNNPNNYANYLVDSGTANTYVVTFPTGVIPASYTAGLSVVMKVTNSNTGASTVNVNGLGAKNILNPDSSALSSGQMPANSIVTLIYDGTQFLLAGGSPSSINIAGGTKGQVPVQSAVGTTTFMDSSFAFKNRIINGAMVIDQRNAGASVTPTTSTYTLDRWNAVNSITSKYTVQQVSDAPTGFINSLKVTSSAATSLGASDYYYLQQNIEGLNVFDFAFGTASAATSTLSFWVKSSLTGTFGGVLSNSAANRSYPFTYTISAANTWEQKTVTITGDTTGTWLTTNGTGLRVDFGLGVGSTYSGTAGAWAATTYVSATGATSVVGTNGATFYITGVQLEKGSTATSFDYRPYGTELALCQRYYESTFPIGTAPAQNGGGTNALRISQTAAAAAACRGFTWLYKVTKRDIPATITSYNPAAANANVRNNTRSNDATISGVIGLGGMGVLFTFTGSTGSAVGDDNGVGFSVDAEL